MKKLKLIGLFILVCMSFSHAQNSTSLKYNVGIPMADLSDFIEPVSWRGISFDYMYEVTDHLGVGVGVAWQTFYEDAGYGTVTDGTASISGNQYRYVNSFPIHATGTYIFRPTAFFTPFVGLGVGTVYNEKENDIGIIGIEENGWQFSLRPELGIQYEAMIDVAIQLSLRYNYTASTDELGDLSYVSIGLGLLWMN